MDDVALGGPHRPEILVRGTDVDKALGAFVFHHDVITENPPHAHHDWAKVLFVCGPAGNEQMFLELARLEPGASAEESAEVERRFGTTTLAGEDAFPWRGIRR
jgi:hypothetical protein